MLNGQMNIILQYNLELNVRKELTDSLICHMENFTYMWKIGDDKYILWL